MSTFCSTFGAISEGVTEVEDCRLLCGYVTEFLVNSESRLGRGGSGCVGSGCIGSGCAGSGCVGSGCAGSGCVGSGCVGSGRDMVVMVGQSVLVCEGKELLTGLVAWQIEGLGRLFI